MLKHHLWLGVGPGQFRFYHYLFYKLPGGQAKRSPIRTICSWMSRRTDQDCWPVAGLLMLCIMASSEKRSGQVTVRRQPRENSNISRKGTIGIPRRVVSGCLRSVAWCALLFDGIRRSAARILLPVTVAFILGPALESSASYPQTTSCVRIGARDRPAMTLMVHLLGAGGIGNAGNHSAIAGADCSLPRDRLAAEFQDGQRMRLQRIGESER